MLAHAAERFDAELLDYTRQWLARNGHALARAVAVRQDLEPGRGAALVIEGIPLISRQTDRAWDFRQWSDRSPVPLDGAAPLSLDGRVRWFRIGETRSDGQWVFHAGARFPDDAWREMVRSYLALDPNHVVLFEETFNDDGATSALDEDVPVVVRLFEAADDLGALKRAEVYDLVLPGVSEGDVEAAWNAAAGYGGGERAGFLTSLPASMRPASGDRLSVEVIDELARCVEGIGLKAFDGEGILVWTIGETLPDWSRGN